MELTTINLKEQPTETATYEWHLGEKFFEEVKGAEIQHGEVDVTLCVHRLATAYDLAFRFKGILQLACDRCLEPMQQPIEGESTLRVRLGEAYEDDGEQITIPEREGTFDAAWNLYEMMALEIPLRHVHPDGQCGTDLFEESAGSETEEEEKPIDPRWNALRGLNGKQG